MREGIARLTLVLGAVMATGPLALDMYLPALPTLEAEFAASTARVQHTVSAYLFGLAVGLRSHPGRAPFRAVMAAALCLVVALIAVGSALR